MSGCLACCMCISLLHAQGTLTLTQAATSMGLMRGLLCRPRRVGASRLGAKQLTDVGSKCGNPPYFDLFFLMTRQGNKKSQLTVNTRLSPIASPNRLRRDLPQLFPEGCSARGAYR